MAAEEYPDLVFDGAYKELFTRFLAYKRGQGYSYGPPIQQRIREFSRFLDRKPLLPEVVCREYFEEFISHRDEERPANQALRINYARQFCLYIKSKGYDCFIPPSYLCKEDESFIPRIITSEEMARILTVADTRYYKTFSATSSLVYPMVLRMLWCCGMRLGEALTLKLGDVDITCGTLMIRKAKNKSTRIIPMSDSCTEYARTYWSSMGFEDGDKTSYFYPSPKGGRYANTSIAQGIKKMMAEADVTIDGAKTPRVHDIRHSFAVAALGKMIASGVDCYCELPLLSIYMGHFGIEETEYYLRLTEYGRKDMEDAMVAAYSDVFPEVD